MTPIGPLAELADSLDEPQRRLLASALRGIGDLPARQPRTAPAADVLWGTAANVEQFADEERRAA